MRTDGGTLHCQEKGALTQDLEKGAAVSDFQMKASQHGQEVPCMRLRTATRAKVENDPPSPIATRAKERGEVETAIRQGMRLHPSAKRISSHPEVTPFVVEPDPGLPTNEDTAPNTPRRAIVSIDGRDVDEEFPMKHKTA